MDSSRDRGNRWVLDDPHDIVAEDSWLHDFVRGAPSLVLDRDAGSCCTVVKGAV